jgi:hypothetical protein
MIDRSQIKLANNLSGAAGQYFVAAELSRRGIIATVTLRNARGVDILAANATASRSVSIQVKTNQLSNQKWLLEKKAEEFVADNLFYVFVNLNGLVGRPSFHIVESKIVADAIKIGHRVWLAGTKKDGGPRKDTSMRAFRDGDGKYLEAWDRLGFDTAQELQNAHGS